MSVDLTVSPFASVTGRVYRDYGVSDVPVPDAVPGSGYVVFTPVLLAGEAAPVGVPQAQRVPAPIDPVTGVVGPVLLWAGSWQVRVPGVTMPGEVVLEAGQSYDLAALRGYVPGPGVSVTTLEVPAPSGSGYLSTDGTTLSWSDGVDSVNGRTGTVVLGASDVGAEPAGSMVAHMGAADPHPQYLTPAEGDGRYLPASYSPPAPDLSGYVQTTDARLSDARTPLPHTHPWAEVTGKPATYPPAAHTHTVADVSGAVASTDGRLSDPRTPTAHKTSHATGGGDALTPADIGAAPALGADDKYVTDAEKTKLANLSGVNTGDQDLSGYVQTTNAPELIRDTIGSTLVAGSNVTITPDDANDRITIAASGELTGTGMPNGVVTANPGTYYTDTAGTNGAWRWLKKSGTGNTGWEVIVGDTGWRAIAVTFITVGELYLRRVNNLCYVSNGGGYSGSSTFSNLSVGGNTGGLDNPIPQGWRTSAACSTPITNDGNSHAGYLLLTNTTDYSVVQVRGAVAPSISYGRMVLGTYVPSDPWPTTLPGTPA